MIPLIRTTTLLQAAPSYLLTDLPTAKLELNIPSGNTTNDAWLTSAIAQVSGAIARYCNRSSAAADQASFPIETVSELFYPARDPYPWQFPGALAPLRLSHWPIANYVQIPTSADTPSGSTLMRANSAVGIAIGMVVGGAYPVSSGLPPYSGNQNIAPGTVVSGITNATMTLSHAVTADIPAGTVLTVGAQSVTTQTDTTSGSTIAISSDAGLADSQVVSGTGIFTGATVTGFADASISLSLPTTADLPAGTQITFGLSITVADPPGTTQMLVASTDFVIDPQAGLLTRLDYMQAYPMAWPSVQTTVVYSGGYAEIPPDVVDAALRWIVMRWGNRQRDPAIRSETMPGLGTTTYFTGPPTYRGGVPDDIAQLLGPYRVPVVA
jgi:hypothetical protein